MTLPSSKYHPWLRAAWTQDRGLSRMLDIAPDCLPYSRVSGNPRTPHSCHVYLLQAWEAFQAMVALDKPRLHRVISRQRLKGEHKNVV